MRFRMHEEVVRTPSLPPQIDSLLSGYTFFKLVRNYPVPSFVYRAVKDGYPTFYLKVGPTLSAERMRLLWLDGKLSVPKVVASSRQDGQEYLLLTELAGVTADYENFDTDTTSLVELIAEGVRTIHSVAVTNCPFDATVESFMLIAERIVRLNLLDQKDLSVTYRDRTIEDLYNSLLRLRPNNEQIVFTHGDYCLPNILIQQGKISGFVDLGLSGLGDPYRDLTLIVRSIRRNLGKSGYDHSSLLTVVNPISKKSSSTRYLTNLP